MYIVKNIRYCASVTNTVKNICVFNRFYFRNTNDFNCILTYFDFFDILKM